MASKSLSTAGEAFVRLIVEAGKASPSPPVGPALGARGVKAMDFCKLFNAQTAHIEPGTPMRVKMHIASDRSFTFTLHSPPTSHFLLKALQTNKGSPDSSRSTIGQLSAKAIYHLALIKHADPGMAHIDLESIARSLVAQARNMGISVVP